MRWSTWAGTYSCRPKRYFQPQTIEEVVDLVNAARQSRTTITTVGSGHSPSTLALAPGYLVNLDKLNTVLNIEPSQGYTDVTVLAGARLYQLNEYLASIGLALQNLGSISQQSVAGVISTGTHGSSAYHGLISDQIVELVVVTANGEVVTANEKQNKDLFRSLLLSLGKFGIIVQATIRVVPAFNLETHQEVIDFDTFLDQTYDSFFTSAEFHRVWWYPYARKCVVWRANRTTKPETASMDSSFLTNPFYRFAYKLALFICLRFKPHWTPALEKWIVQRMFPIPTSTILRSDKAINMDCLFSQFVNEWALPLVNGKEVLRKLDNEFIKEEFYVHSPFEIRATNTTHPEQPMTTRKGACVDGVLNVGPIYGNVLRPYLDTSPKLPYAPPHDIQNTNLTLNLNATMYRPFGFDAPTRQWFSIFEKVCSEADGKPHWAKNFLGTNPDTKASKHHMDGIKPTIEAWYGKDLEEWKRLRQEFDPSGVFIGNRSWLEINGLI